jgi:hypothetical protein
VSWTPETLKDYVDREFHCLQGALRDHAIAATLRMDRAERDVERRLGETERWRTEAIAAVTEKIGRQEWDIAHQQLRAEVEAVARRVEALVNDRIGAQTAWGRVVSVAGVVAAVSGTITAALFSLLHWFTIKP